MAADNPAPLAPDFLRDGGQTGALMRSLDWSRSPLGPPEEWPQSLRSVVGLLLNSKFPMFVAWGEELGFLYNDPYAEILGAKHPQAMGARFQDIWQEIWSDISPLIEAALRGEATYHENLPLTLNRQGFDEQAWFTFSYSPVNDDSGRIAGMFCVVAETTQQVLAEQRVAAETERQLRLFERAPGFIAALEGPEHRFEFVNQSYRRLFGDRDFVGRTVRQAFPDLEGQGFFELLDQVYATGERFVAHGISVRLQKKPGEEAEEQFLDFIYEPVLDDSGSVTGIFCEGHDVTDRRRADADLRESEARFRLMADAVPQIVWITDATGANEFFNRQWFEYTGAPDEPVDVARVVTDYLHPEDADATLAAFQEAQRTGTTYEVEHRVRSRSGEYRWFLARGEPYRDENGRIIRWFGASVDVHDHKSAAEQLRENEERLRLSTEAAEVGHWDVDLVHDVLIWPPRVKAMFGISPDVPVSMADFYAGLHPDDREHVGEAFAAATDPKLRALYDVEYRTIGKEDELIRWVAAKGRGQFDDEGQCTRVIGTAIDITNRRRIEEALRESEARLRIVQQAGGVGSFDYDLQKDEAFCSPEYYALFGLPNGYPINRETWPAAIHPDDRQAAVDALNKAVSDRTPFDFEYRIARADTGEIRWLAGRAAIVTDAEDRPWRFVGGNIDVTARKLAEAELRESEARLRALTDHLPGGMVYQIETDPDGVGRRFLYVSQSHLQLTGIPAEAVMADASIAYGLIHSEDQPRLAAAEAEALERRGIFDVEARFLRADGELRWCRIISAPREQPDGSMIWDGIQIDITKQKLAEEALRLRGEEFYALADNIPSLCWIAYADGHIFWYNRRWYEYTGTSPETQEGWGWESVHDPDMLPAVAERWRHSLETGEPFEMIFPLKGTDGMFRPFLTRIVPIRDEDGEILRWFGTNVDVSQQIEAEKLLEQRVAERSAELEQAQEALRQSQKLEAMGQLTGGVAHDFNNLLTPIIGSLDLLQRKGLGGPREQRLIDGALQSADRAKTLVQRLLAFARRQPLQATAVDLAGLVGGMADLIASTSGPKVQLAVDVSKDLPAAKADPNQLEMAILNLAVNARDAMPEGGRLTISAAAETLAAGNAAKLPPGHYVRLSVADTGMGMDEATLAKAIEPFFSTKGVGKGTGLGLSMVHGLASQLGGALLISSRPGLGTSAELWLPASTSAAELDEQEAVESAAPAVAGSALLVDDEELVRMSTADMLADLGYAVTEAASAEEALRLLDAGIKVDVLITDHMMPGITGAELAREFRERRPGMPVLIVSGYAEGHGMAPDVPRLTKPFRQADLAASLAELAES